MERNICFSEKELNFISAALDMLACHHEDKANIQNETGTNTKYKAQHREAGIAIRTLKNKLGL